MLIHNEESILEEKSFSHLLSFVDKLGTEMVKDV